MESKSYYNPELLYSQCIVSYVKHLKPKPSHLDEIDGLQTLPANILADIYLAVSFQLFGDMTSFCYYIFLLCYSFYCRHAIRNESQLHYSAVCVECCHLNCAVNWWIFNILCVCFLFSSFICFFCAFSQTIWRQIELRWRWLYTGDLDEQIGGLTRYFV